MQIVGCRLEAQAEHGNLLLTRAQYDFDCTIKVSVITRQNRLKKRQFKVEFLGAVVQSPNILGQAGTAEGEPWFEIVGRDIQLGIGGEDPDHGFCVYPPLLPPCSAPGGKTDLCPI